MPCFLTSDYIYLSLEKEGIISFLDFHKFDKKSVPTFLPKVSNKSIVDYSQNNIDGFL
jgi:hypothetical protein